MRTFHIAAIIVICFAAARSQTTSEFITINNGLSQNYIFDVIQDSRGFLWMGTKEGINRYDGYSVVAYRNDSHDTTSLSSNTVTTMFEDKDQILWVGTNSGGLNRFDRNSESFYRYLFSENDTLSLSNNHILTISEGLNNTLWIGTQSGLNHFNKHTGAFRRYLSDPSNPNSITSNNIIDVMEEQDTVWVSTTKGLCYIVPKTERIVRVVDPRFPELQNRGTTALLRDSRGRLLIGGRGGLYVYTSSGFSPVFTANDSNKYYWISRIREDRDKNLWISTANTIVTIPYNRNDVIVIEKLSSERFSRGLWIDRSNVVWAGTSGLGAMMMRPRQQQFGKRSGNFLSELFGREISTINSYFKQHRISSSVDLNFRGLNFFSALEESSDIVWFLTEQGLFRIRRSDQATAFYQTNPKGFEKNEPWIANKIVLDRNNDIWMATVGGVSKFSRRERKFEYFRLYPDTNHSTVMLNASSYFDITSLFLDRNGILWCGTPELGLIRFDVRKNAIRYFSFNPKNKNSLTTNHVLSLQEDPFKSDSILWIGTEGGGLNRFNTVTEQFTSFTTDAGLPNNVIYSILVDGSRNLWMSTNNGLVQFDPRTYAVTLYDTQDGLQSNEFNRNEYYKTRDGRFYFGGIYGYNVFYPSHIIKNTVPPPVAVTEFRLFNAAVISNRSASVLHKSITETDSIELEYVNNMFSLQFAALDFNAPKKNRYAYRLDGFNDDWINANTSRIATYTNIDPGTYIFHVKACNSDGVWNTEGKKIVITILPPFWMTWWFRGLFILIFIAVGPVIYYLRVTGLKKEQHRQQEVSQLLVESQELERKRIAQEMHDSLGQELLVIKNRAVMGLKTAAEESKERRQLEQISDGATTVLKLVRTLSHNLRPPELDRLGITETIRSILTTMREASGITLNAEVDDIDGMIKKENEINLIRILQESLNNIEKHSGATEIYFSLKVEQDQILFTIRDNGKGFSSESVKHGIGLAGISERVRILQGSLSISSVIGETTTISITIPKYNNNG